MAGAAGLPSVRRGTRRLADRKCRAHPQEWQVRPGDGGPRGVRDTDDGRLQLGPAPLTTASSRADALAVIRDIVEAGANRIPSEPERSDRGGSAPSRRGRRRPHVATWGNAGRPRWAWPSSSAGTSRHRGRVAPSRPLSSSGEARATDNAVAVVIGWTQAEPAARLAAALGGVAWAPCGPGARARRGRRRATSPDSGGSGAGVSGGGVGAAGVSRSGLGRGAGSME